MGGSFQSDAYGPSAAQPLEQPALTRSISSPAAVALAEQYRPLVTGYLTALTGNPDVAGSLWAGLARDVLARAPLPRSAGGASSVAASLLLAATDVGLAYLRHVRALQLAGVGGPAPVPTPPHARPSDWLRSAFERFLPVAARAQEHRMPARGRPTGPDTRAAAAARRVRLREVADARGVGESRELLRRKVLRAVLADRFHEDARCLALHLVAGLSAGEVAYLLGAPTEIAAASISSGVEAVALRYDEALEMLGLSASIFEHPVDRASDRTAQLTRPRYEGTPTLRQRDAVAPTRHLRQTPRPRTLLPTIPLKPVPTLTAPRHPALVPVVSPHPTPMPDSFAPADRPIARTNGPGGRDTLRSYVVSARSIPTTVPRGRLVGGLCGHHHPPLPSRGTVARVPVRSPADGVAR